MANPEIVSISVLNAKEFQNELKFLDGIKSFKGPEFQSELAALDKKIELQGKSPDEKAKKESQELNSNFYKYNKDFIKTHGELLKRMKDTLGEDKTISVGELGVTVNDLRDMKAGVYNLWLELNVSDGKDKAGKDKTLKVDSREFIAWQREAPNTPIREWARANDVELVSLKEQIAAKDAAGAQVINVEWHPGKRRIVDSFKALLSEKREGHYGEIVLNGPDGKPVRNVDGRPDIYLTDDVYKKITDKNNPQPYRDKVIVQDRINDKGKFVETKFFFGTKTEEASKDLEASSFKGGKTSEAFKKYTSNSKYYDISQTQFQAWTYDASKNPDTASVSFQDWVNKKWGGREKFDAAFRDKNSINEIQYKAIEAVSALDKPQMNASSTKELMNALPPPDQLGINLSSVMR